MTNSVVVKVKDSEKKTDNQKLVPEVVKVGKRLGMRHSIRKRKVSEFEPREDATAVKKQIKSIHKRDSVVQCEYYLPDVIIISVNDGILFQFLASVVPVPTASDTTSPSLLASVVAEKTPEKPSEKAAEVIVVVNTVSESRAVKANGLLTSPEAKGG